jgi:CheY-like chemotaxis protein
MSSKQPETSARRVLVVDDKKDAVKSLTMLLELLGHEVRGAHDGPTALAVAREYQPDVVLLDIGLPGMDGLEVARCLRQDLGLTNALLVAVTGYGQEEDAQHSQEAGFDAHLVKPLDFPTLRRLLGQGKGSGPGPSDS